MSSTLKKYLRIIKDDGTETYGELVYYCDLNNTFEFYYDVKDIDFNNVIEVDDLPTNIKTELMRQDVPNIREAWRKFTNENKN